MVEKKPSVRSQDPGQRRVLDRAARQRRINRQLEALENDNFQDDPHAGLPQLGKRLPQFDDDTDTGKKKKKTRGDHFKLRFRKNFQALLEEQNLSVAEGPNYLTACAGPPSRPQRPFCAVCGFPSPYTCVSCGARYCTVRCLGTHQETRTLAFGVLSHHVRNPTVLKALCYEEAQATRRSRMQELRSQGQPTKPSSHPSPGFHHRSADAS